MEFFNPGLLFGLAAVAAPILIHLWNRRRFRRVEWGAMRFLRSGFERSRRRRQADEWILLAVRCLLVAVIALALARPRAHVLVGSNWLRPDLAAVIVVDSSASMQTRTGDQSRFDKAKAAALDAISRLPSGASAAVLIGASEPSEASVPEPTGDLARVRRVIETAEPSDMAGDISALLRSAAAVIASRSEPAWKVILVTDGQTAGWRDFDGAVDAIRRLGGSAAAEVVIVDDAVVSNLAVRSVRLASPPAGAREMLEFDIEAANEGSAAVDEVAVSIAMNGTATGSTAMTASIAPGETEIVRLSAPNPGSGYHVAAVSVDREDPMPFDNRRWMAWRARERLRVLIIDEGYPASSPENAESFFLRHAIREAAGGGDDIDVSVAGLRDLASIDLDAVDVLALVNVPEPGGDAADRIEAFVRAGGLLLVFSGDAVRVDRWNRELLELRPVLPGPLAEAVEFEPPERLRTAAADWDGQALGGLGKIRVRKASALALAAPGSEGNPRPLLTTGSGTLAAAERELGAGRTIMLAVTADAAWSDLPRRPAFIPVLARIMDAGRGDRNDPLNIEAGEAFRSDRPSGQGSDVIAVFRLGDADAEGTVVQTASGRAARGFIFDRTSRAGAYEASVADELPIRFAVNPAPAESSTARLSERHLARLREVAAVSRSAKDTAPAAPSASDLWQLAIIAAIALGMIELVLAQDRQMRTARTRV